MEEAAHEGRFANSELFIALVGALGTNLSMVQTELSSELDNYEFTVTEVRLSKFLAEIASNDFRELPFDEMLWEAMNAGDDLRRRTQRSDVLALHAISDIAATRAEESDLGGIDSAEFLERHAFVIRSLKTPDELETLRSIYGPRLIVIAAYSPEDRRLEHLESKIQESRNTRDDSKWTYKPKELLERDEKEDIEGGQNVSDTFHRADFFVRAWDREVARKDICRSLEILFGHPYRTPTRDEHAQFFAAGAALRSSELSRQVGAAIATADGSVLAVGTNEVPKAGGGTHWEDLGKGNRDFEKGKMDANREQFDRLANSLAEKATVLFRSAAIELCQEDGFEEDALAHALDQLRKALPDEFRSAGLKDLTEFGRAVHAEMSALTDAARRGVSVQDAILYTTTFPCHNCTRHLIAAGIDRVVFIEPYPKSKAEELHGESIELSGSTEPSDKVILQPFVGVAPRRYLEMFDASRRERMGHLGRKDEDGKAQEFDKAKALPVFVDAGLPHLQAKNRGYRMRELLALEHLESQPNRPEDLIEVGSLKQEGVA